MRLKAWQWLLRHLNLIGCAKMSIYPLVLQRKYCLAEATGQLLNQAWLWKSYDGCKACRSQALCPQKGKRRFKSCNRRRWTSHIPSRQKRWIAGPTSSRRRIERQGTRPRCLYAAVRNHQSFTCVLVSAIEIQRWRSRKWSPLSTRQWRRMKLPLNVFQMEE